MKRLLVSALPITLLGIAVSLSVPRGFAEDSADEKAIKDVMKLCNKAPKGTPKLAEKVSDGSASEEETKQLIASYRTLKGTKPPKGEAEAWEKRISALMAAVDGLEKKEPGAAAKFKEANGCKACHTDHKPPQ